MGDKVWDKLCDVHKASKTGLTRVRSKSIISETTCHMMLKFCTVSYGCLANSWRKFHQILRWSSWSHLLNWHGMTLLPSLRCGVKRLSVVSNYTWIKSALIYTHKNCNTIAVHALLPSSLQNDTVCQ